MVRFVIIGSSFVAQVFTTPECHTCVSWATIGRLEDVNRVIREQLKPHGIPYEIDNSPA